MPIPTDNIPIPTAKEIFLRTIDGLIQDTWDVMQDDPPHREKDVGILEAYVVDLKAFQHVKDLASDLLDHDDG